VGHAGCSGNARWCGGDKAAGVANAIIAAASSTAAVSGSQEVDWGADTQAETRCYTSPPTAKGVATSLCLRCLAKCDWPGQRWSAARRCTSDMQHLALTCASDAPRSASEALQRSDAEERHSDEKAEIASCLEHSTWHSCELPEERQPIPSHFVYAQKWDGRYKARVVAGGHKQQQGVDCDETCAPVCSYRSVRMMLAVANHEGLEL
jgi:hypothetical protein